MSDVELVLKTLQTWADDPSLIEDNPRAKSLIAKIHREGSRHVKKEARDERRARDRAKVEATGRVLQTCKVDDGARVLTPGSGQHVEAPQLERERTCPICRTRFSELHPFYHSYCPACAQFNWEKRHLGADLSGRIALVTGGRIKIGFECALKLLRCGARVIVTTRFAADAWERYTRQSDYEEWRERLSIVALDLKFLGEVERFCAHLNQTLPFLDILVNNAAQTIARPRQFYASLLALEANALEANALEANALEANALEANALEANALTAPGENEGSNRALALDSFFPPHQIDLDGQQVDLRPINSWRQRLGEIDALEAAQCYVVGALAPFVLTGQLRPLFRRSPHARRFVVQASAMEGNFSRESKTVRHPHTNMTKAALNMLVRTSAADLREDGIWCNAVDTGWITDENPHPTAERLRSDGFVPPLDAVDGAARLLSPIFEGLDVGQEPLWGHFLKDYLPHEW